MNAPLQRLLQPNENIAFLDAEFNNYGMAKEIISLGIVICNKNYDIIDEYYSLINPPTLSKINHPVAELTGIKQQDIDCAPDFYAVSQNVQELVNKYNVLNIYVWGNCDKPTFEETKYNYMRKNSDVKIKFFNYIGIFRNIDGMCSHYLFPNIKQDAIGLSKLAYACEIINDSKHNALSDAKELYRCIKAMRDYNINKKKKMIVEDYYIKMSEYIKMRRIKTQSPQKECAIAVNDAIISLYNSDITCKAYIDDGICMGLVQKFTEPRFFSFEEFIASKE